MDKEKEPTSFSLNPNSNGMPSNPENEPVHGIGPELSNA